MYFPDDLPPGWYALPDGYKRYHDEHGWTDHFLPVDAPEPATPPGSGPAKPRRSGHPLTAVAAVLAVLLIAGGALAAYAYSAGALPSRAASPATTGSHTSSTHATSAHARTSAATTHRATATISATVGQDDWHIRPGLHFYDVPQTAGEICVFVEDVGATYGDTIRSAVTGGGYAFAPSEALGLRGLLASLGASQVNGQLANLGEHLYSDEVSAELNGDLLLPDTASGLLKSLRQIAPMCPADLTVDSGSSTN